ncbi:MAG TPA: C40 family peptidase [Vicinamibacterales bacterium]
MGLPPIGITMLQKTFGVLAVAAMASACASTGAVPKPFPGAPVARHDGASPVLPGAPAAFDSYALTSTALSFRGAPYRNGGGDPTGFDCSGFTQFVFGQYGIRLPRAVKEQFQVGKSVKPSEVAPGDLLFFATTDTEASHVGIAVGGDEFVHAPSSKGVVRVERLSQSYWSQRFIGARRVD